MAPASPRSRLGVRDPKAFSTGGEVDWSDLLGGLRLSLLGMRQTVRVSDSGKKPDSGGPAQPGAGPVGTPGAKRVWNVPHPRNPVFIGRGGLLGELQASLRAESTVVLEGPGGMGKTALVVEYAHRHTADYEAVWWVRADTPETLAADYAGLAVALGLSEVTLHDQALQIDMARRWLEGRGRWLLVLHNAGGVDSWRPFLPIGAGGHVLATTPTPVPGAKTLSVRELSRDDAVNFLLQRTGEGDLASARAVADALGDVPLALEHAAAYVEGQGTLADYLARLRRDAKKVSSTGQPADHAHTVGTTWRVSFDAARRSSRSAGELLRLFAYLAPEDIPHGALLDHPEGLPGGLRRKMTRDKLDDLIAVLSKYSLLQRHGDAVSVHRLVQTLVREDLSAKDQRLWAGAAVRLMASTFHAVGDDPRDWPHCERLLAHALVVAEHSERLSTELRGTSHLLNGVALYLRSRAQFEAARTAFERALAIDETAYGPADTMVGADLNNLALVLRDLGDLAGAKEHLRRALAIDEAARGPGHPVVGTRLNNLALVLRDLGDLAGARECLRRALAIDEEVYGPKHRVVGTDLYNLALVLRDLGDLAGANERFGRALYIAEVADGPDHPVVGTRLNSLAMVLLDVGDLTGAKARLARALAIDEEVYGPDHPKAGADLNNLALVLQDLGDLAGAKACLERALAIDEAAYGSGHVEVGTDLNNLAWCCRISAISPVQRRASSGRWPSMRLPMALTTRRSAPTSTTSPWCYRISATSPVPRRASSGPWPSLGRPTVRNTQRCAPS